MVDVPEGAGPDDAVVGRLIHRAVVALVADFEDPPVGLRGGAHPLAAGDVPGHHLLAEHVLAGLEAADREIRMRPERRSHDHRLDVFLLQHLAPVRVVPRHGHRVLLEHRVGQRELRRVDVAERTHLGVLRVDGPELRAPLSADANEPQAHAPARHRTAERRRRAERRHGRGASQHLEEVAASLLHLFGREIHTAASVMLAAAGCERIHNRSSPAMRPVRKANSTPTAHASIRFLLTKRYVPSARSSGPPVGIAER